MTGNCGPELPILDAMALRLVNAGFSQVLPCQKRYGECPGMSDPMSIWTRTVDTVDPRYIIVCSRNLTRNAILARGTAGKVWRKRRQGRKNSRQP